LQHGIADPILVSLHGINEKLFARGKEKGDRIEKYLYFGFGWNPANRIAHVKL
jgi:hypothetical protein